jgi:lipid II isoglutaminyl synthase (glutamine-hydrolysing)
MKLTIGYFYPELLNLYGDNGNIEILAYRARARDIKVEIVNLNLDTKLTSELMSTINLVFMGGGPDSGQKAMYEDLFRKKPYIREFVERGGVGLYICGAYQLFGHYYKAADGTTLEGLGIFDLHTRHFGNHKPRCIGNLVCELNEKLRHDIAFNSLNKVGSTLVGFENHGGRTYLGNTAEPLGKVVKGFGNNGEDNTEGVLYKNSIGTYSHGPLLSKNPHIADYLIAKSLDIEVLKNLDDYLIIRSHTASRKLRQ